MMKNQYIGHVSSEGGPLLVADALAIRSWSGIDGIDYDRACQFFLADSGLEGGLISVGDGQGLLWDIGGAGIADVFLRGDSQVILVRAWTDAPDDDFLIQTFVELPSSSAVELGTLNLPSGMLAVLWATENGNCIEEIRPGRPAVEKMSTETSGLLLPVLPGLYVCSHDEVETADGQARRCYLRKQ